MCVTSGQVFRWTKKDDGSWFGVDGDYWYDVSLPVRVSETESTVLIRSNGTLQDFEQLFRLDWNAEEIAAGVLEVAPELAYCVDSIQGLRLMCPSCSTESFFSFLCTPNNNLTRIVPMARHLATYGPVIREVNGTQIHRFPDVAAIAMIPEGELRAKAFGYRAATIPSVAHQVLQRGDGWIESLKNEPYERVHSELCQFKGIGPKLADCIALFALHHTEAIPIDTHIWQAYSRLYRPDLADKAITDMRYREAATFLRAKFGRLGGWAQQYLFYDNMVRWRERARIPNLSTPSVKKSLPL